MACKEVVDAVAARLAALFSACPVVEQNSTADAPADGGAFVVVQYPVARAEQRSIGAPGSNVFREMGAIRFVIHTPRGSGLGPALTIAGTLTTLFRNASFDGVRCYAPTSPVTDDENDQASMFLASISVPYDFDTLA